MRLTRTRHTVVTWSATGVLVASVSWGVFALSGGATAANLTDALAATAAGSQSCQPLQAAATPTPTPTPTPTTAAPTTPAPTTAAPTTPTPTTPTVTQTVTVTVQPTSPAATTSSAAAAADVSGGSVHSVILMAKIAPAQGAAKAATAVTNLCVEVTALQQTSAPGQLAQWSVAAWSTGGNVANAALTLAVTPAGTGAPQFSLGCAVNGTSTCSLGTVDAASAHRQLQAQLTVPATATAATISLSVTGSATSLLTGPAASAPIAVGAATSPIGSGSLPVGGASLPVGATLPGSTTSPGGSAATLFPTLAPSGESASVSGGARQVASTSSLPAGDTHVGVELAGLFALAAAFVLAVSRVSVRRRPAAGQGGAQGTAPLPPVKDEPPSGGAGGTE